MVFKIPEIVLLILCGLITIGVGVLVFMVIKLWGSYKK
jgi:hypothetical protein